MLFPTPTRGVLRIPAVSEYFGGSNAPQRDLGMLEPETVPYIWLAKPGGRLQEYQVH